MRRDNSLGEAEGAERPGKHKQTKNQFGPVLILCLNSSKKTAILGIN